MKKINNVLAIIAISLIAFSCSDKINNPSELNVETSTSLMSKKDTKDRYIVVFKKNLSISNEDVKNIVKQNNGVLHFRYKHTIDGFSATLPRESLNGIKNNPHIDYIESDGIASINYIQYNPPSWGLDRIDQTTLPFNSQYRYSHSGNGVTVYIIDTGIRFDHQEFNNRAISGYDFVDMDNDASDCHTHGTHVAGIVGGSTVGVAKDVSLVSVRVLDSYGTGYWSQVIAGIDWVTANHSGTSIANMSLGGGYMLSVNQAVENSINSGVVYVVSAGNSNDNACNYSPASTTNAITVGATTNWEVVAFDPTQIKSVDNQGTWNPHDPNIMK